MAGFRPLFVFGLARSGTNLLARMLDGHPAVSLALDPFLPFFRSLRNAAVLASGDPQLQQSCPPDSPFHDYYFADTGPALLDTMLDAPAYLPLPESQLEQLREAIATRAALESPPLAAPMRKLSGDSHAAVLHSGLGLIAARKPEVQWVGSKEVWALEFLPWIARAFPQARFVVIERDPRAIIASLLEMARKDPSQAAHPPSYLRHWRKQVALCRHFQRMPQLASALHVVSFEAIALDPEPHARQLCASLGLDFTPRMLELSATGWRGNSSYDHGGRDVYTDTVDQWRRTLPEAARAAADFMCGPEMSLTAYRTEGIPAKDLVLSYIESTARMQVSWRSDSGDALRDFANEDMRQAMCLDPGAKNSAAVRKCFLFQHVLDSIHSASRQPA